MFSNKKKWVVLAGVVGLWVLFGIFAMSTQCTKERRKAAREAAISGVITDIVKSASESKKGGR